MKKPVITLLLILIATIPIFSQDTQPTLAHYLSNFQYQKALEYIETQEPSRELLVKKALCYKALGEYKKAIDILKPLSVEYPESIQIKSDMAVCYESLGLRQAGVDCYDDLIRLDTTNLYFKIQKAELLFQDGKYDKALTLFKNLHGAYGLNNAIKRSALCFEKMNMVDSAKYYFAHAWEVDSTDSFSAANLINLNLKGEYYGNGILLSDIYLKRDSTNHRINVLNALSYYGANLYEEAIKRFTRCYLEGDSSLVINRSLGISHYSLKESYKAKGYLEAAYRQDTTNNNVLYCLAVTYTDMADYELAIPYFQKLLDRTIPPDLTLYLYYRNLADSYSKTKAYQDAYDRYVEAIKYGTQTQKMNLYFTVANLCEYSLKNRKDALKYYKLYKTSLTAYLEDLQNKEGADPADIANTRFSLKNLEDFLKKLETSAER